MIYGLHYDILYFLYCKLTQFVCSKHSLLWKLFEKQRIIVMWMSTESGRYIIQIHNILLWCCNWIFLQFSTVIFDLFTKIIFYYDISMTKKMRLMRTYSVVCWTKRDRKVTFSIEKNIKINYRDTTLDGPRLLERRWWVLYVYIFFDNVLTPGHVVSYCLIKYRCRWHCYSIHTYAILLAAATATLNMSRFGIFKGLQRIFWNFYLVRI